MISSFIWWVMQGVYRAVVKPVLFLFPPDSVHDAMIKHSAFVFHAPPVRWLAQGMFRRKHKELFQELHGVMYENPVGLSAGFDKNGQVVHVMNSVGFGFATVGSVTSGACEGNPRPWFYRLPKTKSIVVNAGLANHGSRVIFDRLLRYTAGEVGQLVVSVSVAKANDKKVVSVEEGIQDYIASLKRLSDLRYRVKMIEINISCPNVYGGEPFTNPTSLESLMSAIDDVDLPQPVYVKMPSDLVWEDFNELLKVIVRHNVNGVTICNLAKNRNEADLHDELPIDVPGNLSGTPTNRLSNDLIERTYLEYGDKLTIIGVGGIFSAEDAYEKIRLGASMVALITGMIFEGPQLIAQINQGLVERLRRDGYKNINQVIGTGAGKNTHDEHKA